MCVCGAAAAAAAAVVVLAVVTRMSWLWMAHQISNSTSKLHIVLSAAHTLMDSERAWGRISWIPSTHLQYDETYNEESYCVCKTHNERRERKKVNSFSSRWTWHSFDRIAFVYTERFWLIYILAARAAVFAASAHKWMAHMDYYFIVLLKFIVHPTKWMPRMPDPSANREEETPRAFRCVFVGIDFNFQRRCVFKRSAQNDSHEPHGPNYYNYNRLFASVTHTKRKHTLNKRNYAIRFDLVRRHGLNQTHGSRVHRVRFPFFGGWAKSELWRCTCAPFLNH